MLVLNLNAANTELSEVLQYMLLHPYLLCNAIILQEFPDFDSRLLPLLEVYSELMVFRSQYSELEV